MNDSRRPTLRLTVISEELHEDRDFLDLSMMEDVSTTFQASSPFGRFTEAIVDPIFSVMISFCRFRIG
jgi:hypothetical protein